MCANSRTTSGQSQAPLQENGEPCPIEILAALTSPMQTVGSTPGLAVIFRKRSGDMHEGGVIEPPRVGRQAIRSASERTAFPFRPGDTMLSVGRPGEPTSRAVFVSAPASSQKKRCLRPRSMIRLSRRPLFSAGPSCTVRPRRLSPREHTPSTYPYTALRERQ